MDTYGKIDFLVNNAGILIPRLLVDPAGIEEITEEVFDKMVSVNQNGSLFCTQAVIREMFMLKIKGVVINVSSESSFSSSSRVICRLYV